MKCPKNRGRREQVLENRGKLEELGGCANAAAIAPQGGRGSPETADTVRESRPGQPGLWQPMPVFAISLFTPFPPFHGLVCVARTLLECTRVISGPRHLHKWPVRAVSEPWQDAKGPKGRPNRLLQAASGWSLRTARTTSPKLRTTLHGAGLQLKILTLATVKNKFGWWHFAVSSTQEGGS